MRGLFTSIYIIAFFAIVYKAGLSITETDIESIWVWLVLIPFTVGLIHTLKGFSKTAKFIFWIAVLTFLLALIGVLTGDLSSRKTYLLAQLLSIIPIILVITYEPKIGRSYLFLEKNHSKIIGVFLVAFSVLAVLGTGSFFLILLLPFKISYTPILGINPAIIYFILVNGIMRPFRCLIVL